MKSFGRMLKLGLVSLIVGASAFFSLNSQAQISNGFEKYQLIISKNPFGRLGPLEAPVMPDFAKGYRLCSLIEIVRGSETDFYAGFAGNTLNSSNQVLIKQGELTEDGLSVTDIDVKNESVKLWKNGESALMNIQSLPTPTNSVLGNSILNQGQPVKNPWQEFYQRYQQRHVNEGSLNNPSQSSQTPLTVQISSDGKINRDSLGNLTSEQRQQIQSAIQEYRLNRQSQTIQNMQNPQVRVQQLADQQSFEQQSSLNQKQHSHSKKRTQ